MNALMRRRAIYFRASSLCLVRRQREDPVYKPKS
jgi:hypothetical protein